MWWDMSFSQPFLLSRAVPLLCDFEVPLTTGLPHLVEVGLRHTTRALSRLRSIAASHFLYFYRCHKKNTPPAITHQKKKKKSKRVVRPIWNLQVAVKPS